jgi:hypothetical protein
MCAFLLQERLNISWPRFVSEVVLGQARRTAPQEKMAEFSCASSFFEQLSELIENSPFTTAL